MPPNVRLSPASPFDATGAGAQETDPRDSEPIRLSSWLAIFGLFVLLSAAVVLASWPGYRIARHTRMAESAMAAEDWEAAIPHLTAITTRFPDAWRRQRQLGDCLLALDRAPEALDAYDASLKFNPDQDLRARVGRAIYLINPADERGPRFLKAALADSPADPEANFYVALYYKDLGRYREAATHLLGATAESGWFRIARPHIEDIRGRLLRP
jgi:cytochrome c-type biogenesis protein CcmH/NrfG